MKERVRRIFDYLKKFDPPVFDKPIKVAAQRTMEGIDSWETILRIRGDLLNIKDIPEYLSCLSEMGCLSRNGEPSIIETSEDGDSVITIVTPTRGGNEHRVLVKGINSGSLELIITGQKQENPILIPISSHNYLPEILSRELALLRINEDK